MSLVYTLEIKRGDNSHYWTDYFDSAEELEKWLEEEKTRPYFKKDFTTTMTIRDEPSGLSPADRARDVEIKNAVALIKAADTASIKSVNELRDLVVRIAKAVGIL